MDTIQELVSLYNGISEQDPVVRLPSYVEDSINCYHSLDLGLRKRNPSKLIGSDLGIGNNAWIYTYDKGDGNKFVFVYDGTLKAYDLSNGTEVEVTGDDSYLSLGSNYSNNYNAITVNDSTFITNKSRVVTSTSYSNDSTYFVNGLNKYAYIWVKKSDPVDGYEYIVRYNGATYTINKANYPSGSLSTSAVANQIATLTGGTASGNIVKVLKYDGTDRNLSVSDNYGGLAISSFYKEVETSADLPYAMPFYDKIKIVGKDNSYSNYYVEAVNAIWVETYGNASAKTVTASTMPHKISYYYSSGHKFRIDPIVWDDKYVGDDTDNKLPSMVGSNVVDLVFHRNRLGFLTPYSIVFSEVGKFYNLWKTTQASVLDSDRIDITLDTTKSVKLHYALFLQSDLLIFGDNTQFKISVDNDIFSSSTISSTAISNYEFNYNVKPIAIADTILFLANKGDSNELYEFSKSSGLSAATSVSQQIPYMIDSSIKQMVGSSVDGMIFLRSSENPNIIYVYKYLKQDNTRIQSSWFKWRFNANVRTIFSTESTLYMVNTRFNRLTDDTWVTYNGVWNNDELWDDLYYWKDADNTNYNSFESISLNPLRITDTFKDMYNDGTKAQNYTSELKLSTYYPTTKAGASQFGNKVNLKTFQVNMKKDSDIELHIFNNSRSINRIVSKDYLIRRRPYIMGKNTDIDISIVNNSSNGFEINGVAYEARINNRSKEL